MNSISKHQAFSPLIYGACLPKKKPASIEHTHRLPVAAASGAQTVDVVIPVVATIRREWKREPYCVSVQPLYTPGQRL